VAPVRAPFYFINLLPTSLLYISILQPSVIYLIVNTIFSHTRGRDCGSHPAAVYESILYFRVTNHLESRRYIAPGQGARRNVGTEELDQTGLHTHQHYSNQIRAQWTGHLRVLHRFPPRIPVHGPQRHLHENAYKRHHRPTKVERVLFIGTQFSKPLHRSGYASQGRVVVCLVFVCLVFACKYVLRRSRVSHPLNLQLCLLRHLGFLTSPDAIPTCIRRLPNSFKYSVSSATLPPPLIPSHGLISFIFPPRPDLHYIHLQ